MAASVCCEQELDDAQAKDLSAQAQVDVAKAALSAAGQL